MGKELGDVDADRSLQRRFELGSGRLIAVQLFELPYMLSCPWLKVVRLTSYPVFLNIFYFFKKAKSLYWKYLFFVPSKRTRILEIFVWHLINCKVRCGCRGIRAQRA